MCNVHFILTLTPPWLQVKVTKYFDFVNYFCWRVLVCVRFSSETTRPISPMMIPINWGNNVDLQHKLNFDLHPSMTAGQGPDILWFCEFWCLMGSSLCSLLLRNYSTDFSNADTNLSSEKCRFATYTSFWPSPLQGHKILQFCEFRLLPWHECWYMSGPYKVAGDRLDLVDSVDINTILMHHTVTMALILWSQKVITKSPGNVRYTSTLRHLVCMIKMCCVIVKIAKCENNIILDMFNSCFLLAPSSCSH